MKEHSKETNIKQIERKRKKMEEEMKGYGKTRVNENRNTRKNLINNMTLEYLE